MKNSIFNIISLTTLMFLSCSGFKESDVSDKCPNAGTEVQFAKLMNPGFAEDYVGCDIITTAQFIASGVGENVLYTSMKDRVVFRCLPQGVTGEKNSLSGEIEANFVVIPKVLSDLVFKLKPGDLIKLRGGNSVYSATVGGNYKEIVFVASSIERIQNK
jgi:hypothetical protein